MLFEQGTWKAWHWAQPGAFIRWFTDGERRYGIALWKLASIRLKAEETHPDYGRRKVWRQGLEVAMKIARVSRATTSGVGEGRAPIHSD